MNLRRAAPLLAVALLAGLPARAPADFLELDPGVPLDQLSTNSNDGYFLGRGTVFTVDDPLEVLGAGLWTNLRGSATFTWSLFETDNFPGEVNDVLLTTASATLGGAGPTFYDVSFAAPVALDPGSRYHIEVTFTAVVRQNAFFLFDLGSVDIGPVKVEDGTLGGDTGNTVMPLIRLQVPAGSVPEPSSFALVGAGLAGLLGCRWRCHRPAA
jgi:hypothetical protein